MIIIDGIRRQNC